MSGGVQTKVVGAERLTMTLARAAHDVQHLDRAGLESSHLTATAARAEAPRRTGRLANSIHALEGRDNQSGAGSSLVYAPVIHGGWYAHNIAPNRFMERAVERVSGQVVAAHQRDVESVLGHVKGA